MSTTPIRCPECGELVRVAVQASVVKVNQEWNSMKVIFDDQNVAHTCKHNRKK